MLHSEGPHCWKRKTSSIFPFSYLWGSTMNNNNNNNNTPKVHTWFGRVPFGVGNVHWKGSGEFCFHFAWRAAPPLEGTNWDALCGLSQWLGLPRSPWQEGWDKGSESRLQKPSQPPSFPRQCLPLQELSWACYYPVLLKENSKGSSPGFMWGGYFYLWKTFPVYN